MIKKKMKIKKNITKLFENLFKKGVKVDAKSVLLTYNYVTGQFSWLGIYI